MGDVTQLRSTGNSSQRVDLVIVAEGYTANERAKFLADAERLMNYMFEASDQRLNDPFSAYKNFFNVNALFVASAQSGADRPNQGLSVDTYFDASHYGGDERLLYGDEYAVRSYVASNVGSKADELVIVLVNTDVYGGAGGGIAWAAAGNPSSFEVALHEIGHSFAGLQDEYADPSLVSTFLLTDSTFRSSVHVTDSTSRIPWSAWLGYTDELGTVGTYEGGYYRSEGVWRATPTSKMLQLGVPFSAPEREAFVLKFYEAMGDYAGISSPVAGILKAEVPDAGMFRFDWSYDGKTASGADGAYLDLGAGASSLSGIVSLRTTDGSGYVRSGLASTSDSVSQSLAQAVASPAEQKLTLNSAGTVYRLSAADNEITLGSGAAGCYIDGGAGSDTLAWNAAIAGTHKNRLSTGTILVEQGGAPALALRNIEKIRFSDASLDLTVKDKAATISAADLTAIEELYVAYFNRIPDASGISYWIDAFRSGQTLEQIGNSFYSAAVLPQYAPLTGYSATMTNADFVRTVYRNVLGRAEVDDAGLNYWTSALASGTETRGSLVKTILASAHTFKKDPAYGQVADLLDNKLALAHYAAVQNGFEYVGDAATTYGKYVALTAAVTATDTGAAVALMGVTDSAFML
ncbi:MAG TPA: M64 family metallopeptidase [Noviherbaspirillum sp.]|uniref:M64 family metallopeptidase n=1 Tax=Noviherbaspirillum sp. TaxID=1926288 RepID=UPI002D6A16A1|nr:M64 family metallopeptidase [Noviherbaspirillum sp.]HYD96983.1 M64 family metallopeptidase [Noviherbaspirillum sp.]